MNEPTTNAEHADAGEQRVGQLAGDRYCHKCQYLLTGQSIVREPKYDLLIVRCPECGAVSPLHEYPALGRWSRRLAAIAAACVLFIIVAAWMANAGVYCGLSIGAVESSTWNFARQLDQLYRDDHPDARTANIPQMPAVLMTTPAVNAPTVSFDQWWADQDPDEIVRRLGGLTRVVDTVQLVGLAVLDFVIAMLCGGFWSIVLIRRGPLTLIVWGLVIIGTALGFCSFVLTDWLAGTVMTTWDASRNTLGPPLLLITLAHLYIGTCIGMAFGRAMVRGLVRLLVPPALWPSLNWLWTARGLEPPRQRTAP